MNIKNVGGRSVFGRVISGVPIDIKQARWNIVEHISIETVRKCNTI